VFTVVEVKSTNDRNEKNQLCLGLGEVLDFADTIRRSGREVRPVSAVEREPTEERWTELCGRFGVTLVWRPVFERLVD
jgi:hypothetical protein